MYVFRLHVIWLSQQSFLVEIHQRVDEAPFIRVCASHKPGIGLLLRNPQPVRLVKVSHGGNVGKHIYVFLQRLDAEIRMDIRAGLHQDQVQFVLFQHFGIIRIECHIWKTFLECLILQPLSQAATNSVHSKASAAK